MLASQRKQQILQILAEEKQVMSGDLSQRFSVSEDSIRRDLRELAAEGKLQRVHGGALPVSEAIAPIETRKSVQMASKQTIAQRAVELIQPGQVVIIDGGTTTGEMVRLLPATLACTVVTHSPGIAVALVVFATWKPTRLLLGAYLFGFVTILQFHAQGLGIMLPVQFLAALPYLATIVVLVVISHDRKVLQNNLPASLGKPFLP